MRAGAGAPSRAVIATLLAAVTLAGALAVDTSASAHSAEERELAEARERIEELGDELAHAEQHVDRAESRLREADARLDELEAAVNQAAAALERQEELVEEHAQRLERLQDRAREVQRRFQTRAVELYKHGGIRTYEALLEADDVRSALERSEFVRVVTLSDRGALEEVVNSRRSVAAERERLAAERAHLADMKEQQEQLLAQARELRRTRALRLAEARQEAAEIEERHDHLKRNARELKQLIRQRRRAPSRTASPSTSGYIWPRCDTVTSEYGRRWGRLHAGIDIDGATGDPIRAAKGGEVIYAAWRSGYGRLTLVEHGDGVVTAYAHQSAFAVSDGQRVSRGQRIGSVGSTGNSTGAHLHFETRVNGNPVNPRRFLPGSC